MTSLGWDENIIREKTGTPDRPYAQLTDRAKQECKKRIRAYVAVRQPQEHLDPRIVKLNEDRAMPLSEKPYLHYGLIFNPLTVLEPCIVRNGLEVELRGTPEYEESNDLRYAMKAVLAFLGEKSGFKLTTVLPLEDTGVHVLIALDNTDKLCYRVYKKQWNGYIVPALQIIRDELGLGDQKAMWWWDAQYGLGYVSPIPDYNPPQINEIFHKPQALDGLDSDSSESESESEYPSAHPTSQPPLDATTSLEWNENLCLEMSGVPPHALTDRAEEECEKRMQAHLAVRQPQEDLDPRIIKLAKNLRMSKDEKPYLHYGLIVNTDAFEACVARNRLKVALRGTPEHEELYDMLEVMDAIQTFLQRKTRLPITLVPPFESASVHLVIALDDTDTLRHRKLKKWGKYIGPALQIIRNEFGLGDQKAMWWWDSQCGLGYVSPIPDYNPPQINQMYPQLRRPSSHLDSDSSESESEN